MKKWIELMCVLEISIEQAKENWIIIFSCGCSVCVFITHTQKKIHWIQNWKSFTFSLKMIRSSFFPYFSLYSFHSSFHHQYHQHSLLMKTTGKKGSMFFSFFTIFFCWKYSHWTIIHCECISLMKNRLIFLFVCLFCLVLFSAW